MSGSTSRRKVLAAVLAVIVVVAVASAVVIYQSQYCCASPTVTSVVTQTQPKLSLDHVTFVATFPLPGATINWPAMLASKLGFYDKYGLTVDSVPSSGSLEALSAVATGKAELGQLAAGVGVTARGNGTDVRYVFMTFERSPSVVYALEKTGIRTPKDLEGKTMGISFASGDYLTMPLLAKAAGFDYKKVKYVNTPPAQYVTLMLSGQIDFTISYFTNYYVYQAAAAKQGDKLVGLFLNEYVDVYGAGVVTTDSFIRQHADVVKVFNEGYAYGLQYLIDNPKEASTLLATMMTGTSQDSVYALARTHAEFKSVQFPRQSGQPYGIMDDKTWDATVNVMVQYLGAKVVAPKDMYTNEFVPTQYVPKAQMIYPIGSFCDNLYALPYKPGKPTPALHTIIQT